MKYPKLLRPASGKLYGALSTKGKLYLYAVRPSSFGPEHSAFPGWDFPVWEDLKDAICVRLTESKCHTGWIQVTPFVIGLSKSGEVLSYARTIDLSTNASATNWALLGENLKSSALAKLTNVDRVDASELDISVFSIHSGATVYGNPIVGTRIRCFHRDGTATVVVWIVDQIGVILNQYMTVIEAVEYSYAYSFKDTDIIDIVDYIHFSCEKSSGRYESHGYISTFYVLRKGGILDVYKVPYTGTVSGTKEVTEEHKIKSYTLPIEPCRLLNSINAGDTSRMILYLLDSNNDVYYCDNEFSRVKKFASNFYHLLPGSDDALGDKMSAGNRIVDKDGHITRFPHSYENIDAIVANKEKIDLENLKYIKSAFCNLEQGHTRLAYVNSEGQMEFTNKLNWGDQSTLKAAGFKNLGHYFNRGLLTSKNPINLLDKTSVSGFTIKGIEPANTKRRVALKVEDKWNKLSAEGALTPLATQEITADSVLEEGNTVAELEAITATTGLAGKLIYPAVALYAEPEAEVMPTFGMTVKAEIDTTVNVYSYTGYSQEYNLSTGEDVQVVNVAAETETTGEGNVVVTARLKQGGEWTDYMALSDTAMKQASALQLKAVYTVTNTDGSQSAKVKNVTIRYTTSGATVNGVSTDIVTKTQRFTNDLVYAHCYVKHKKLQDAVIDAYCSLRKRPKSKTMYQFGNGTGALNTYKLPDAGINQDTLSVYVAGKAVYDFGYNTETSEITLTADKDTALSASYECGWELSEWIKMVQGVSQVNDGGGYTTEYSYTVPTHEGYEYTVTAIKYSLVRPEGKVTEEAIGVGTGKRQMIELPHFAKKESIVCNGAWSYDYDRKLLTVIAPKGEDIIISYDWIAETPTVYAISAGWAD